MNRIGHLGFTSITSIPLILNIHIPKVDNNFVNTYIIDYINYMIEYIYINLISGEFYYPFVFLFLIFLGTKTPDIDLLITDQKTRYKTHRQITHSLLLFFILIGFTIFYKNDLFFLYLYGIGTHLIADMITGTIPIFLYGAYYKPNKYLYRIGIDNIFMFINIEKFKKILVKYFDKIGLYIFYPFLILIIIQIIYRYLNNSLF